MTKKVKEIQRRGAIRSAKYRERKIDENREEFLKKRAIHMRMSREKKKFNANNMNTNNENEITMLPTKEIYHRLPLRDLPEGYNSRGALNKAVQRVAKHLPQNPAKEKAVVQMLANRLLIAPLPSNAESHSLSSASSKYEETYKLAKEFFLCDSVSKQLPGRKDNMKIDGMDYQKRVMMMTVCEAYDEYLKSYSEYPLSRSKFYELRPPYVLLSSHAAHYSCCCGICQNTEFLYDAVKSFLGHESLKLFINHIVCSRDKFDCVTGCCEDCKCFEVLNSYEVVGDEGEREVKLTKWEKGDNGFMQKSVVVVTFSAALECFISKISQFMLHKYLVSSQYQAITSIKSTQQWNEATIHIDFSENYTTICQNDLQSAYFGRNQIEIFCAVVYVGLNRPKSIVCINEDTSHSKEQAYYYLSIIIDEIKKECPELSHINILSDGCAQQFKNKFMLASLLLSIKDFGVTSEWHFSPTSHGKGAVDGLGGTLKRNVRKRVLTSSTLVYSAKDFYECAISFAKNINLFLVDQSDVDEFSRQTLKPRWEKLKKFMLRKTREFHFFNRLWTREVEPLEAENAVSCRKRAHI